MSRTVRKQLFNMISSLQHADDVLKQAVENNKEQDVIDLLSDCQECAINVGNRIEGLYGAGLESVKELENYCETIYQLSISIKDIESSIELITTLKDQIKIILNHMEHELPDKLEVVFLPYKASMWDSLESVWLAARDNETCDAYVIPIPYYDKNPDGSFRAEHWEVDEYPDYVPITKYDGYDFDLHRPDIIFIHNPYDNNNYVTSVHPYFYSKNLKQFTDRLVYIPYFIIDEIDSNDKAALERVESFCVTPGVINAHTVIVQSEEMKAAYIKIISQYIGKESKYQDFLQKKIWGLGSPKIDKVLNTNKDELNIPDDWLKIIQKPDGTWKKIIFYNTSVTTLLQHNEQTLEKIKSVFMTLKEKKDEVALLWRPHPLIMATLESMRPDLLKQYITIVDQYKQEHWGIYDDSSDLTRAVTLCDAYYGDTSSVIELCSKENKIIIIQKYNQ